MRRAEEVDRHGAAAEADDRQVAAHAGDLRGHPQGRVDADHVEHELGALPARHVLDAGDRLVAGDQRLVGAHASWRSPAWPRRCPRATTVVARAERVQDLDGHLAEAAGPDHHGGRARPEQVQRPLDRVIAGERRVG